MKIVIVGLGVIGGSYAMALKAAGYKEVCGIDINKEYIDKAEGLKVIKKGFTDGKNIIKISDVIILAIYPKLIKGFIEENRYNFKKDAIITDATGIKEGLINEVLPILPKGVDFIFGHPMAGREKKGIEYASKEVFKGANYLITVTEKNKEENIKIIEDIAYRIGFRNVKKITPKYHDEMISLTSQLPHAIAVALINSDKENRDTGNFIGDSYRDLTRIANINEELWSELFLGNKKNLINAIDDFVAEMNNIRECLVEEKCDDLKYLFNKSRKRRGELE